MSRYPAAHWSSHWSVLLILHPCADEWHNLWYLIVLKQFIFQDIRSNIANTVIDTMLISAEVGQKAFDDVFIGTVNLTLDNLELSQECDKSLKTVIYLDRHWTQWTTDSKQQLIVGVYSRIN